MSLVLGRELVGGVWALGAHSSSNEIVPRTSTRIGAFGGQFKQGNSREASYSEPLVYFVILFHTRPPPLLV